MRNNRPFFPVEIMKTCENHATGKKAFVIRNRKSFIGKKYVKQK